jgi:putative oxygen-independent coproporphyrinogen III oxidase
MLCFTEAIPLALYLHLPWCVRKCPYCDFNSHQAPGELPERAYVGALLADLEAQLPKVWGRKLVSVFIGGGTPSLFSPEAIDRLLAGVRSYFALAPDVEVTLEANPGTADAANFAGYAAAGVNRLSLGVQSLRDDRLATLGRIHGRAQAVEAFHMARAAGFASVNLDLMFALPGDGVEDALEDLRDALALGPEHLSWYHLTLEPGTPFHHRPPPAIPDDDTAAGIQQAGHALLEACGFGGYEVSAWARPGQRCVHNLNYWAFGDYLGIGAGAHAKLTDVARGRVWREERPKHPAEYQRQVQAGGFGEQEVKREDLPFEFMLNALRLNEGFPTRLFLERTGLPLSVVSGPLQRAEAQGLVEWSPQAIRPTPQGRRYLNDLMGLFLP